MSRSYKKNPYSKDNGIGKDAKRICAHKIRNIPIESEKSEILVNSPSAFRKINRDTWDIHDYVSYWTLKGAMDSYYREANLIPKSWQEAYHKKFLEDYPTVEDYLNKVWAKYMKRK